MTCKKRLRKHARYNLHGDYGDGAFCGMECGYLYGVKRFNQHEKQEVIFELERIADSVPGVPAEVAAMVMQHHKAIREWLGRESGREVRVRIPTLKIEGVHKYIAAVGRALERGQLEAKQANGLLYAAQLLIAAHRALGEAPRAGRHERSKVIEAVSASIQTEVQKCLQRSPRRQHGKI